MDRLEVDKMGRIREATAANKEDRNRFGIIAKKIGDSWRVEDNTPQKSKYRAKIGHEIGRKDLNALITTVSDCFGSCYGSRLFFHGHRISVSTAFVGPLSSSSSHPSDCE